jgi:hypothetical protein
MLDLAAVVEQRVIEEAEVRGMFDLWAITDQLARNPSIPGRRGCGPRWAQVVPA